MFSILVHSVALCTGVFLALSTGTIYHCIEPGHLVEFTDLPCSSGRAVEMDESDITRIPSLSPDLIDRLHDDSEVRIDQQKQRSRSSRTQRHQQRKRSDARCTEAGLALDDLINQRRKGYSLADSARLEAREAALKSVLQEC